MSLWGLACTFDSSGQGGGGVGSDDTGLGTTEGGPSSTDPSSTTAPGTTAPGTTAPGTTASSTTTAAEGSSGDASGSDGVDASSGTGGGEESSSGGSVVPTCNGDPLPVLPDHDGPFMEISVANVAFPDSGTNLVEVSPGATVTLEFDFELASCECMGCIAQGMMGIVDGGWRDCFFQGVPACNTAMGAAQMEIDAPSTPGFYEIAYWRTWEYNCEDDAGDPASAQAVAGICVLAP